MELANRMKGKRKKDLSKIKCFNYCEMGYFPSNCPKKEKERENKKGKKATLLANKVENHELTRRLEEEEEYIAMIYNFSQGTIREDG